MFNSFQHEIMARELQKDRERALRHNTLVAEARRHQPRRSLVTLVMRWLKIHQPRPTSSVPLEQLADGIQLSEKSPAITTPE